MGDSERTWLYTEAEGGHAQRTAGKAVDAGRLGEWGSSSTGNRGLGVALLLLNVLVHEDDDDQEVGLVGRLAKIFLQWREGDEHAGEREKRQPSAW
jgi:hypothetical protein